MRMQLLCLALAAGVLLAPAAHAQDSNQTPATPTPAKERGEPSSTSYDLDFSTPGAATLRVEQVWDGQRGADFRQSLDAYFGNGDGKLAPDEIGHIQSAAVHDMQNQSLPLLTVDGAAATVQSANVTLEGAEGNVSSADPVKMTHSVVLALPPQSGDSRAITFHPVWDGHADLHAPDGQVFVLPGTTQGVAAPGIDVTAQSSVTFTMRPQTAQDQTGAPATPSSGGGGSAATPTSNGSGGNASAPQESAKPPRKVPLPSVALVVGACALIALALPKRRLR